MILDGAMGTMLQSYGLSEMDFRGVRFSDVEILQKGNNDLLNLTRPDIVCEVHNKYLAAGADIITTNTFSSQRVSQSDYGLGDYSREIALAGSRLARDCADAFTLQIPDKPRFVAGSLGPTNKSCSISPDVRDPSVRSITFDELADAYKEEVVALLEGGVDLLLFETIFDTLNCKAGLYGAREAMEHLGRDVPILLSVTISDRAGRTLTGQTLDAFLASVSDYDIFSVGLNCSFGAEQMYPFLREMASKAPYYISVHPNAGLPNSMGGYDQSATDMASQMSKYVESGIVNIIGGCCGTTDDYIRLFPPLTIDANGNYISPRIPPTRPTSLHLSGLDLLDVAPPLNFVNIGERCNVAGSAKFRRLILGGEYEEALSIARKQVEDGAMVIDVCMDHADIEDPEGEMVKFLNLMMSDPDISRVPVMIDSSHWDVIRAGLRCVQGKSIVNSISLKEGESVFLSRAREIRRLGAAVVVMAFDEEGQATSYERRIDICRRCYRLLTEAVGFRAEDIIFDPNVLAVATGIEAHNRYALDFILATEWIRKNLPGSHVSGGVSNLSFSFRGNNYIREAMHSVFLYHTIQAGQDMGIVNPSTKVMYSDISPDLLEAIDDVLLNRRSDATERLVSLAEQLKGGTVPSAGSISTDSWHDIDDVGERLVASMVRGDSSFLSADISDALSIYPDAVSIISGPLMSGMNRVGDLFASGKMFLPQVVKTARTMKKAVTLLEPYLQSVVDGHVSKKGRILLATVKGDVHDIGKNIVGLVLSCNNYDVIDLGVMVPAEEIVRQALDMKVDIIGLSGLITPSLEEMVHVARCLEEAGADIPLMIGGATTNATHAALKIAPVYHAPVLWMSDASQNVLTAEKLLDPQSRGLLLSELSIEQQRLSEEYMHSRSGEPLLSLEEARKFKFKD